MVSTVLVRTLAVARPWFNERVAEARQRQPGFDVDALRDFISTELDAVATAVAGAEPDRVGDAVQVAYEIGIELVGQRLLGPKARLPWVRHAWGAIVPTAGHLVARSPRDTLGALSNAAVQTGSTPGVRTEQWIELLAAAAPQCTDLDMFRRAGAVCAWRAGMVHLRDAALASGGHLPTRLAMVCLGLDPDAHGESTWSRLRADRWCTPDVTPVTGHVLGGFTGFGGTFPEPPGIRADATGFIARAGERVYALEADVFGAAALSADVERFEAAGEASAKLSRVVRDALAARLQVPEEDLIAVAHGGQSLVAASPWSHRIYVGPLLS